jgi:hypothetical protein
VGISEVTPADAGAEAAPFGNDGVEQRLFDIMRSVPSAGRDAAGAALGELLVDISDVLLVRHLPLLLGVAFRLVRTDIVGAMLARQFLPGGSVEIEITRGLGTYFIVLFEKVSAGAIRLAFSRTLCDHEDLIVQTNWLVWAMPLLAHAARSESVPVGAAFLNQWDGGVVPGLAYCAAGDGFFLVPDNVFLPTRGYADLKRELLENRVPWAERIPLAFWRGATTGRIMDRDAGWRSLQRVRLCELARLHPESIDAGLTKIVQMSADDEREIRASGLLREFFTANALQMFRWIIDVDGNTNAWGGMFERLLSGSPVLKIASPGNFRQWYYDRLQPWQHFVPVESDASDLVAKIEWLKLHDREAERIGANGRALAYSLDFDAELDRADAQIAAAFRAFSADCRGRSPREFLTATMLRTCHGSIVAYDSRQHRLVHVLPEIALLRSDVAPLRLVREAGTARLLLPEGQMMSRVRPDGGADVGEACAAGTECVAAVEVPGFEPETFALRIADRFLCADANGAVTADRVHASTWEAFRVTTPAW